MKNKVISVASILIFIALLITCVYFYNSYRKTSLLLENPTLAAKEEVKALSEKLSALMVLPKNEEPSIITVLDIKKLQGQPFFINAKNGDKVILYSKSNKVILYRPEINKIIEVAPIQMGGNQEIVKIGILNGAPIATDSALLEKELTKQLSNIVITSKRDAKGTYEKMLVIDVQGTKTDMAKQLAQLIGAEVSKLPKAEILTSEEKKNMDLLIILGNK